MRRADAGRPFGQALHDAELVGDVVQVAGVAVDVGQRHLAGDRQHGRVVAVGLRQRRGGVEEAGARHHAIGGRLAGGHGRAERQVGGPLLVAGVDGPDAVGLVVQGIEEGIVLHARQAEQRVDAVRDQPLDDDLGRGPLTRRRACCRHVEPPWLATCLGASRPPATVLSALRRVKAGFMRTDMPAVTTRPSELAPSYPADDRGEGEDRRRAGCEPELPIYCREKADAGRSERGSHAAAGATRRQVRLPARLPERLRAGGARAGRRPHRAHHGRARQQLYAGRGVRQGRPLRRAGRAPGPAAHAPAAQGPEGRRPVRADRLGRGARRDRGSLHRASPSARARRRSGRTTRAATWACCSATASTACATPCATRASRPPSA